MVKKRKPLIPFDKSPLYIAGLYIFISILWIIYSDKAVEIVAGSSSTTLSVLQTAKGGFFVIATGLMLYFLVQSRMKKLRFSETRFKTLAENTPDAIACFDLKGRYVYGNSVFTKQIGISDKELFGKSLHEFDFSNDLIQKWEDCFQKVAKSKAPVRIEFQTVKNEWFDLIVAPQFSDTNQIISLVASARNITEKKSMQEQLHQSQKMQAIGQLAGGIAHDFNNILSIIMGYTDMAVARVGSDETLKEFLINVQVAGDRARHLVRQILSFSRKKNENIEPILLSPVVAETIGLLKGTLPSTINLTYDIQADTQPVLANSSNVHEIIMNLATNAQHAMDEKGNLTINLYEKKVPEIEQGILGPIQPGMYSIIEVKDSGEGIKNDKIQRIFEPFFTTKDVGKGTGLGLSVVFGLMQSWQGNIQVISKIDEGTLFKLFIPKTEQTFREEPKNRNRSELKGGNERILLVDDEEAIAKMGKKMLALMGYKVTSVSDSYEALSLLKNNIEDFDLLISDQTMPGLTGEELAKEILRDHPDFPILLCSGFSTKLDEARAKEIGCRGFVHKPLTIEELSEKVRDILS
ncbi:MAG: response regulator [Candidatus Marinimicrobia bacterium]|nr:response regulator [Candidatus Neomarinimicrobiota bacterium]